MVIQFILDTLQTIIPVFYTFTVWNNLESKVSFRRHIATGSVATLLYWVVNIFIETDFAGEYLLLLAMSAGFITVAHLVTYAVYLLKKKSSQNVWNFLVSIFTVLGLILMVISLIYIVWQIIQ